MDLLNNYSVVNDGILTIDNCKTICESYLVNTNYQFMTLFYLSLVSLIIYKIIKEDNFNNIPKETKEIIKYYALNISIILISFGIIFYSYLKITGGLI